MSKYKVSLDVVARGRAYITVEAEDEYEASNIAKDEVSFTNVDWENVKYQTDEVRCVSE